ncbi:unnamed protein product [Peronospora belbahrii]|uniref:histone acetyltransferase n=1 Tax=Peronospora belbahrii TaxID=622444 RepID=A0AAU9L6C5_9STRA|nr:unnamed protein product [Peronospora belbahrii]
MASETADKEGLNLVTSITTDDLVGASETSSQNTEEFVRNSQDSEVNETKQTEDDVKMSDNDAVEQEDVEMRHINGEGDKTVKAEEHEEKVSSNDVENVSAVAMEEDNKVRPGDDDFTAEDTAVLYEKTAEDDIEMKTIDASLQDATSESNDTVQTLASETSKGVNGVAVLAEPVAKKQKVDESVSQVIENTVVDDPTAGADRFHNVSPSGLISRDDMAKMEEDSGRLKFDVITNDGANEHMIQLTTLKNIFAKQLPKMPKEYIVRLVFDKNHRSMLILKNGTHVIGGICYRPFEKNRFAEIAFCAINASDQVKGYGTRLMNHLKEYVKTKNITHFLTYADNYAIGYFKKQGFTKTVSISRPNWYGYIKDYDGGTLMECTIHTQINYLRITSMIHQQRKAIQDKIQERSHSKTVYPGLTNFAEGRLMDIYMVPGVKEAGWSQAVIRNNRVGTRDQGSLKSQLSQLLKAVSNHRSAWPFHEPVDTTVVVDYLDHIKDPVDLQLISKRIESGNYVSKAAFKADLDKMCENCMIYNTPDTNYYKAAMDLREFIQSRIQIRDHNLQIMTTPKDVKTSAIDLDDIDFDELDDYLELFQQDGVIKEAISKGVDLREYAQQIDEELRAAEAASIAQYVIKSADIVELHDEVQDCDNLLAKMQEMLLGFQADLGSISDEIRYLQDESIGMNIKLKNRRETEEKLQMYLDQVVVAPSLIKKIDEGEMNEVYLHALVTLNGKLRYAAMSDQDTLGLGLVPSQTAAFSDVKAQLKKLKARALVRIRDFLLAKMNEVKKPKTNVQMMQQNTLLPMKYLVTFLADNAPEVEDELRRVYSAAMSKTLVNVFRSYHTGLMKFYEEVATRTDVIVVEEQSLKGMFSSRVNLSKRNDTFSVTEREKILETVSAPALILHVAQQEQLKLPYEAVFRNMQQHLMDSATSEYLFLIEFFKSSSEEENEFRTRDLFMRVFAKTLSLCLENLENYLFTCYDAIGLLLMIRLTYAQRLEMEKRRISCLDAYFDRVTLLLWPRFKAVFDLNLMSVKNAKAKKLGPIDRHPHFVIRRYAEFASSILSLSMSTQQSQSSKAAAGNSAILSAQMHENGQGDMILNNVTVMRDEILCLLLRLAEQHENAKDKCVFLINNYDLVLTHFEKRRVTSEETPRFEELRAGQREKFVEEELATYFAKLIQFIEQIVHEFALTWRAGIETINGNVMTYFSNFRNGMEILKQVLTQLLLYYTRFVEVVKRSYQSPPPFNSAIITTQEILYEIKKYSRSF